MYLFMLQQWTCLWQKLSALILQSPHLLSVEESFLIAYSAVLTSNTQNKWDSTAGGLKTTADNAGVGKLTISEAEDHQLQLGQCRS